MSKREVIVSSSLLGVRDGKQGVNVGDRVEMVETEKGLRSTNPHDPNAKRIGMRVVNVRETIRRDPRSGKHVEVPIVTLREEG